MQVFRLSQPELIVLAKVLLQVPVPPLGMPPDPELAERPFQEVVLETLARLLEKGWVQVSENGTPTVPSDLADLLRTAGYLEAWMVVFLHERVKNRGREVAFYWDGERVVQHELDRSKREHIFRPGPDDMGYAWVKNLVAQYAAPASPQDGQHVLTLPGDVWEMLLKARLEGQAGTDALDLSPPTCELAGDVMEAALFMRLDCLCSVYRGEQEEVVFLLGPHRNWMLSPLPCPQEARAKKSCMQARAMTRPALERTLYALWRSLGVPLREKDASRVQEGGTE